MAKPRQCPTCDGLIKNHKALRCWGCYQKYVPKLRPWIANRKGIKHPNWTGGGWMYWRKQALIRDNHTCKTCGLYDPLIVEVDHIKPIQMTLIERRNFEKEKQARELGMSNLQTLCPNCHRRKSLKEAHSRRKTTVHVKPR